MFCQTDVDINQTENELMILAINFDSDIIAAKINCCGDTVQLERTQRQSVPLKKQSTAYTEMFRKANSIKGAIKTKGIGLASKGSTVALCFAIAPEKTSIFRSSVEEQATILLAPGLSTAQKEGALELVSKRDLKIVLATILEDELDPTFLMDTALNAISIRILLNSLFNSMLLEHMLHQGPSNRTQPLLNKLGSSFLFDIIEERDLFPPFQNSQILDRQILIVNLRQMAVRIADLTLAQPDAERRRLVDMCPVCPDHQPLPWTGSSEATCPRKHVYSRCALTFLPILSPEWSKICIDCRREFMNERMHPELQTKPGSEQILEGVAPPSGLNQPLSSAENGKWFHFANCLFEKFDLCPYCGGFFAS